MWCGIELLSARNKYIIKERRKATKKVFILKECIEFYTHKDEFYTHKDEFCYSARKFISQYKSLRWNKDATINCNV